MLDISNFSLRNLYIASLIGKETGLASEDDDKRKTIIFFLLKTNEL